MKRLEGGDLPCIDKTYVTTPTEVIDFIARSCQELLKEHFGVDLDDERVKLMDPCAGEGQFICRMVETGEIKPETAARAHQYEINTDRATQCEENTKKITGKSKVSVFNIDTLLCDPHADTQPNQDFQANYERYNNPVRVNKMADMILDKYSEV